MRINTDGKKAYRSDLYERTADTLDENTKTGAIDRACMHVNEDIDAKHEAIEYLTGELPLEDLEEVAEILSTDVISVGVEYEIHSPE